VHRELRRDGLLGCLALQAGGELALADLGVDLARGHRLALAAQHLKGANTLMHLGSGPVVLVDEAAESVLARDRRTGDRSGGRPDRDWRAAPERPVWALVVVVLDEDVQDAGELAWPQDQQPVETLGTHGPAKRSANAFACGARNGVRITVVSSLRKTSSKAATNFESRS
jgi:hypothetical protein